MPPKSSSPPPSRFWKYLSIFLVLTIIPWAAYLQFRNSGVTIAIGAELLGSKQQPDGPSTAAPSTPAEATPKPADSVEKKSVNVGASTKQEAVIKPNAVEAPKSKVVKPVPLTPLKPSSSSGKKFQKLTAPPVMGPPVTNGSKPLWGMKHKGTDAIMALACKYPVQFYKRFVGTLRKFGYTEDIVLAVSPVAQMKPGVENYLKSKDVLSYGFEVECAGPDNCRFKEDFLGYPDPREYRTFANIRYALYEYWLQQYEPRSYVLILDFRDTFFQGNPMGEHPKFENRIPRYDLRVFAENFKVKSIENCVFNSMWVRKCFGKEAFDQVKKNAVICSGSTYGSYPAITHYVRTMLHSFDTVQCWKKGIESDQGYQSYLFYTGAFNTADGNATKFEQGDGVVNTIGALNGFRVPAHMKGPLDTHWKIRDPEGYILNNDGSRSICIHQWDRWYAEISKWLDTKLLGPDDR